MPAICECHLCEKRPRPGKSRCKFCADHLTAEFSHEEWECQTPAGRRRLVKAALAVERANAYARLASSCYEPTPPPNRGVR